MIRHLTRVGFESGSLRDTKPMSKSLVLNLRKACLRRGLKLRVGGEAGAAAIFNAKRRLWAGPIEEGMDWLTAAYPVQVGRPVKVAAPKAKRTRSKSRGARTFAKLTADDPGIASEDMTPADAQGLVETEIELPEWLEADAALIALWRCLWRGPSPAIRNGLEAARRALRGRTEVRLITLSDADRASLADFPGTPGDVFTAAALAPRAAREIAR